MKNIHILPTDKPSRLAKSTKSSLNAAKKGEGLYESGRFGITTFNIYITSDEEIKYGDYYYNKRLNQVFQAIRKSGYNTVDREFKVILTTDQDLIKDGVQAIDNEFLEWFIKNPSCEEVEVVKDRVVLDDVNYNFDIVDYKCKIIIQKEEPKQETLEESLTAEEFFRNKIKENIEWEGEITLWKVPLNAELSMRWAKEYSDYVIKWQQQQMYSEEEVLELLNSFNKHTLQLQKLKLRNSFYVKDWFEQYKKK